jgi:hypothetical protein
MILANFWRDRAMKFHTFYLVLAIFSSHGCKPNSSELAAAGDYGLDADPIAKYMADAEKTVESKEALHKKLEAELAKPSMSVFVGMRDKSPVARAVFTDQFMSTYKRFLSSTTLASIYRLKPGRVVFTNEGRSEFAQQGARLALSSEPMTNPELQLVTDDKVTKCAEMSKKWEDDTGITKQKEIVEGKCGFGCAYLAALSGSIGNPATQLGSPSTGTFAKQGFKSAKFAAEFAANGCNDVPKPSDPCADLYKDKPSHECNRDNDNSRVGSASCASKAWSCECGSNDSKCDWKFR